MYLSKLDAPLVTSTLSEKLLWGDSGVQNQNFDFGISWTLILYARSIFSQGSHLLEILREKNIFRENPVEVRSFDGTYIKWLFAFHSTLFIATVVGGGAII